MWGKIKVSIDAAWFFLFLSRQMYKSQICIKAALELFFSTDHLDIVDADFILSTNVF